MTPVTVRVVWPITDPAGFSEQSIHAARQALRDITDRMQATLVGPPAWQVSGGWLVMQAPAIRRRPTVNGEPS